MDGVGIRFPKIIRPTSITSEMYIRHVLYLKESGRVVCAHLL